MQVPPEGQEEVDFGHGVWVLRRPHAGDGWETKTARRLSAEQREGVIVLISIDDPPELLDQAKCCGAEAPIRNKTLELPSCAGSGMRMEARTFALLMAPGPSYLLMH